MKANLVTRNVYASFVLTGKDLLPENITNDFNINPSNSFKRGDIRRTGKKWPHGYWALESSEFVESSDLLNHIEWIINKLEKIGPKLQEIVGNQDIAAKISCFWVLSRNDGLCLTTDLMKRMAALNIPLELDVYPLD